MSGLYPKVIIVAEFVVPFNTGTFAAIPSDGVSWYLPANGIRIVPAPIVESNFSASPFCEHTLRSLNVSSHLALTSVTVSDFVILPLGSTTSISVFLTAPFVFRKSREISHIILSRHFITSLFSSVTTATGVASRFSLFA